MASVAAQDLNLWKRSKEDLITYIYTVDMANITGRSSLTYVSLVVSTSELAFKGL